jgi:hypothetical protein
MHFQACTFDSDRLDHLNRRVIEPTRETSRVFTQPRPGAAIREAAERFLNDLKVDNERDERIAV